MTKRMKAYLPRGTLWVLLLVLAAVWGVITYVAFGTPVGRNDFGLIGWIGMSVVILLVGIMIWLMSSGRLPAYILEIEEDPEDSTKR